jgi:hypothetical protein
MIRALSVVLNCLALIVSIWLLTTQARGEDLAGWADGPARRGIVSFVTAVTTPGPDFVRPAERVAVAVPMGAAR